MHPKLNYTIHVLNERALIVQFEQTVSREVLTQVLNFNESLRLNKFSGLIETVPSYCSLTIYYNPEVVLQSKVSDGNGSAFEKVSAFLNTLDLSASNKLENSTSHTIPVCYDARCGLDLHELSKSKNLTPDEISELHTRPEYLVYVIGFTPGFPYMGTLPAELMCARKKSPRKSVPPGSVAIAGVQTGIYPFETPGGWQIIGRTPVKLFSLDSKQPALLKAGDTVRFEPISFHDYTRLSKT